MEYGESVKSGVFLTLSEWNFWSNFKEKRKINMKNNGVEFCTGYHGYLTKTILLIFP